MTNRPDSLLIESLYRISQLVSKTEDPAEALSRILDEITQVLNATSASIRLINPENQRLEIEVSRGLPDHVKGHQLHLGQGITGWVALHGEPLLVPDVTVDHRYFPIIKTIKSEMAVPLIEQNLTVGVINVDSDKHNAFGRDDLKQFILLTTEASRVVSRIWNIRQLKLKAHKLESLINAARNLATKLETGELLDALAEEGQSIMPCRMCALFLLSPDGKNLHLKSISEAQKDFEYEETLTLEESSIGTAILRRKQVEILDLQITEENHFTEIIHKENLVSLLATPMVYENKAVGVLNVYTDHPHRFSNDEKGVLATLAGIGAMAIKNSRLYTRVFETEETLRKNEKLTTLGLLAAEIAHEIRNPLMVIKLLFESLELGFPQEDNRNRDVNVIGEKLDQLENIVTRVLEFGRTGGVSTPCDLSSLVNDTLHLMRLKLHQSKITLEFSPHKDRMMVEAVKDQLQQAILNLVLNATQAMPDGGNLSISTHTETMNNTEVAVMTITDTGFGIPEDIQLKIFHSFLSGRTEGTGLGLAIVKRILQSHRGDAELIESTSRGTGMKIWLPRYS